MENRPSFRPFIFRLTGSVIPGLAGSIGIAIAIAFVETIYGVRSGFAENLKYDMYEGVIFGIPMWSLAYLPWFLSLSARSILWKWCFFIPLVVVSGFIVGVFVAVMVSLSDKMNIMLLLGSLLIAASFGVFSGICTLPVKRVVLRAENGAEYSMEHLINGRRALISLAYLVVMLAVAYCPSYFFAYLARHFRSCSYDYFWPPPAQTSAAIAITICAYLISNESSRRLAFFVMVFVGAGAIIENVLSLCGNEINLFIMMFHQFLLWVAIAGIVIILMRIAGTLFHPGKIRAA